MRIKFAHVADAVLTISAATVAIVVVLRYAGVGQQGSRPSMYKVGEPIPSVAGINFADNDKTLLLILRSTCHFCTESMPFYRRLVSERQQFGRLRFVALSTDDGTTLADYLRGNGLQVDQIVTVKEGEFKANATPTLVLVNRAQRVTGVWTGQLSATEENTLVKAVCVSCTAPESKGGRG